MTKSEYIRHLMLDRVYDPKLMNAAFIFYYSNMPLSSAIWYMNNLQAKVIGGLNQNEEVPAGRSPTGGSTAQEPTLDPCSAGRS